MSCWALVPLKEPGTAKRRLATVLRPEQRVKLVEQMFGHVIDTLRRVPGIDGVAVTSPEPVAADVTWLADRDGELNTALKAAAVRLAALGATELVVLHADLPRVGTDDVEALLEAGRAQGMALAADHRGRGTNALYTRLPPETEFCFGQDSLQGFNRHARQAGIMPAVLHRPGLAFDVDEPGDLLRLDAGSLGRDGPQTALEDSAHVT